MLPILPFVMLFAAGLIWRLWQTGSRKREIVSEDPVEAGSDEMTGPSLESDTCAEGDRTGSPESADAGDSQAGEAPLPAPMPLADLPVASIRQQNRSPGQRASRLLAIALTVIGLIGGLFWSLAYVNGVYGREHTWISASRWIYENVPEGSAILWELWDDPLPKSIPGEAGMDMGSTGLYNIDWSPYEEDTEQKYEVMREKLKEADYVAYSSKRIYDSVDELPERYPMTNRYYASMWDGSLGFELALDQTSSPRLFGLEFDDRHADESWSLYDHPQVTIFRKVRQLSDAEYDAIFAGTWEAAVPWYRGKDLPLSPFLSMIGLGSSPESEGEGLLNRAIGLFSGAEREGMSGIETAPNERASLDLAVPLDKMPVVDQYRWNQWASENSGIAIVWWWFVLALLGWIAWPYAFGILRPLRDRGYLFSRSLGWLISGWLLWWLASLGWMQNSVRSAWTVALVLGTGAALLAYLQRRSLGRYLRRNWGLIVVAELLFALAYLLFVLIRLLNPDLWQPWFGGEKFMEFAFLNGILRSPSFPPLDPHFAGGQINYYYFGIYLVAYLIKLTGIYAEVAFNLAIPTLFALTVVNAFAVAYSAVGERRPTGVDSDTSSAGNQDSASVRQPALDASGHKETDETSARRAVDAEVVAASDGPEGESGTELASEEPSLGPAQAADRAVVAEAEAQFNPQPESTDVAGWRHGLWMALLAPLFVTILGNLDGFAQLVRTSARVGSSTFSSTIPGLEDIVRAATAISSDPSLPSYDFWGPSRVIPSTINEFPFWSFLFADLHPHLIGIPFSLIFLGLLFVLFLEPVGWSERRLRGTALLTLLSLMLGTLATVNLWELPTYLGLGLLAFVVSQYYRDGHIQLGWTVLFGALYFVGAFLAYWPFFSTYQNIGASGVGLVRAGDALGLWLLIWGLFLFVLTSWIFVVASRPTGPRGTGGGQRVRPTGVERMLSMGLRRFDRLPRVLYLQRLIVKRSTLAYELARWIVPLALLAAGVALWLDRAVLALCLPLLGLAFLLLWRRGRGADAAGIFVALLAVTGLAILAGTQVVYLKDFLQGGDWYRMNTLFKFFSQVWVIWGVAAAIALPRIWSALFSEPRTLAVEANVKTKRILSYVWAGLLLLLIGASLAYPLLGTPARVDQRLVGWRPPFGTLNGLAYMEKGVYTWPDAGNKVELQHDWAAIQWLLQNVRGNPVLVESAEVDYYRAGGTRVASLTGLSGLRGMHASEQRYGDLVGQRDGLHREFWNTADVARTIELMDELDVAVIYVGQLERYQHRAGVEKLEQMADDGLLVPIYSNERVTIYSVPGELVQDDDGRYRPS
jgi:YYY domain-containing protein